MLSVAYQWAGYSRKADNECERLKAENDWTAQQAAMYPDGLVAFCRVNPLRSYALDEIARCARNPRLRTGLKLHFGNSDVDVLFLDKVLQFAPNVTVQIAHLAGAGYDTGTDDAAAVLC